MISLANEYNQKIARLNQKQNEESALIDAVREKTFEAFDAVEQKGGTVPSNPDDQKLGSVLNQAIGSIPTDNMPIDSESDEAYFGCDSGGTYICSNIEDKTNVAFGREGLHDIYGRNQEEGGESDG